MEYASFIHHCITVLHYIQVNPMIYSKENLHLSHLTQIIWLMYEDNLHDY